MVSLHQVAICLMFKSRVWTFNYFFICCC